MNKFLILAAAGALAAPLAAQTTTTTTPSTSSAAGAATAQPVYSLGAAGTVVDQLGNTLSPTSTGQFQDRSGAIYTVDGSGRLLDPSGNVVSAPGVVISTGQSSMTGVAPSLPGIENQAITLGPQTTLGTTTTAPGAGPQLTSTGATEGTTRVQPGLVLASPAAPPSAGTTPPRTAQGGGFIETASGERATVGTSAQRSTVTRDVVYTVRSFDGTKLVLSRPNGSTRSLRVTPSSMLPPDLSAGRQVIVTTRRVSGSPVVGVVTYFPVSVPAS